MYSILPKSLTFCRLASVNRIVSKNHRKNQHQQREAHTVIDNFHCPNILRGIDYMRDPRLNKGLSFSLEERQALGLIGLLAPALQTQEEQVQIARISVNRYKEPLNKYLFLVDLLERNERLFFRLIDTNIEKYLPIVYTPTVGEACQKFGLTYRRAKGLFISINDKGHIYKILKNWPEHDVRAICFTDGERILGLGDLGAYGMGIPIGKLALYTALAGIMPHQCLPITLDVGTDNKELLEDPLYIGIRRTRVRGPEYFEFLDEFMEACVKRYSSRVLLQFEDFALPNAMPLLEKYRERYCTFNDDIQGTASVAVAGLLAATRVTKKKISENIFMFFGAGSASNGIANLSVLAMKEDGLSEQQARDRIFMFDIDGLLTSKRPGGVPVHAKNFSKDVAPEKSFEAAVATVKPTVLIGCSTVGGAFNANILKQMGKNAERPIIFALSNPTSQAECTAQQAYDNTDGRCVFASGSPFPPVQHGGKVYKTGQGNNSYIFPGVALGVIAAASVIIPDTLFLAAAQTLAKLVKDEDLALGRIYPPLADVKCISTVIAAKVAKACYDTDIATNYPKPKDYSTFVKNYIYDLNYPDYLPDLYPHPPKQDNIRVKSIEEAYGIYINTPTKPKKK